jgi:hypothetical protein
MNNSTLSVLTEMILQDAKTYADRGDNTMAIKLWRYSMTFEKRYKQIESSMEKQIRKKIRGELKIKTRRIIQ